MSRSLRYKSKYKPIKDLAVFLKAFRAKKGFTQAQLAEKLDISIRTIQQWEQGYNHNQAILPLLNLAIEFIE